VPPPQTCTPKSCTQQGLQCGLAADGCGQTLNCGGCDAGTCGGGGVQGQCGTPKIIPLEYTFNTPTDAGTNACGRVLFSDFHVINNSNASAFTWPAQCGAASPMNAQEKVFEYMLFDLSSCIAPDVPPPQTCTPKSCTQQGLQCGLAADGCGQTLNCGGCDAGTCGGGGVQGQCGTSCATRNCAQLGANCGTQGDGCGGTINCGSCDGGQSCGGGGTPNVCGGSVCIPQCPPAGVNCGPQSNGCGGICDAGTCKAPQTCGGGGVPGQCGGGMMCNPPCPNGKMCLFGLLCL